MRLTLVSIHRPGTARHLITSAAAVILTLGMTASLGAVGAWAADSDGIASAPSADGGVDQTRSRFSYQVEPGQIVTDEYLVQNTGTTQQKVSVYATDAFNAQDGSFALLDGDQTPTDTGAWVSFADGSNRIDLTLEPGAQQVVPFTVTVPADANPGDHAGGMIVSALSPSGQVTVDRRVAIRLYARVKGEVQAGLTISSISSSYEPSLNPFDGITTMTLSLTNTGNVALGANTVAQVRGIFGIPLSGLTDVKIPEMLPGNSRTVTITIPGVGPYVYLAPHVSLSATTDAEALNAGALPTAERDSTLLVVPWGIVGILLLIGLIWFGLRLRRRSDAKNAAAWVEFTEAEALRKASEIAPANALLG
jgi:hypothetical protein